MSQAKTTAQRKAAERERKAAQGLKRYEVWLHPEDWREVKAVLDRVKRRRARK